MKNRIFLLCALSLAVSAAWAERVHVAAARRVAETVMAAPDAPMGRATTPTADGLSLLYAVGGPAGGVRLLDAGAESEAGADVYVFGGAAGFVVVAGDDCVAPVLGYAPGGRFDAAHVAPALQSWLEGYAEQIAAARAAGVEATAETTAAWSSYLDGTATPDTRTEGVNLETAEWGQEEPYNRFTPTYSYTEEEDTLYNMPTCCVATAMAIIMHHHRYPEQMVRVPDTFLYSMWGMPCSIPSAEVDIRPYDWDNMPDRYADADYTDAQGDAVARLMRDCGFAAQTNYTASESFASNVAAINAMINVFGYSPAMQWLSKEAYTWKAWGAIIREDLDNNRPVIYAASLHAFVCDGYAGEDYFHINWGWDGYGNGYFKLHVMDVFNDGNGFTWNPSIIRNIIPDATVEYVLTPPFLMHVDYALRGDTVTASGLFVSYSGVYDATFYMGVGVADASGHIIQVPDSTMELHLPKVVYDVMHNQYVGSLCQTLSAPLSGDRYATLMYSSDGMRWNVMPKYIAAPGGIRGDGSLLLEDDEVVLETLTATVTVSDPEMLMAVTDLDNGQPAAKNDVELRLAVSDAANMFCRVTIADYATVWKDHLAVYNGKSADLANLNGATPFAIGEDGSFCIDFPLNAYNAYSCFTTNLSFLSDKEGELRYTVAAYLTVRPDSCVARSDVYSLQFVQPLALTVTAASTRGKVGEWMPFTVTFDRVPEAYIDRELRYALKFDYTSEAPYSMYLECEGEQYWIWDTNTVEYSQSRPCRESQSYTFAVRNDLPVFDFMVTVGVQIDRNNIPTTLARARIDVFDYRVTAALTNLVLSGDTVDYVNDGDSLTLTLSAAAGYSLPEAVTVTMGGDTLAADSYRYADGCLTLAGVTGDVVLTAAAVPQAPTAIGAAAADGIMIRTAAGRLYIEATQPGVAYIIDFAGRLLKAVPLTPGETATSLPAGAYIVRVGNTTHKLRL